MQRLAAIFILLFTLTAAFAASTPDRAHGISMHMLPKRVAELGNKKWGFVVSYASYLKPEQSQPVLQTTSEFFAFVQKQDKTVRDNGVWIVITHPDAYSPEETKLLEDTKTLCKTEKIPLFVARGSQLPNGWQRYDAP